MSGIKIKLNKNLSKNFNQDLNIHNKLQFFSPIPHQKIPIKKILLDCLTIKENKKHNQTNFSLDKPKNKSFSLYKYSIKKNSSNIYIKGNKTQNPQNKIIINCLKKTKINNNINKQRAPESNGSSRKSSDASPVEIKIQNEKKNYDILSRNPQQFWKSLKINSISLKKTKDTVNINSFKNDLNNLNNLNNFKSKSKEKEYLTKIKESGDVVHPVIPSQLNYFLNNNKGYNTTGKKETFYNSVCQKKIEPLKLFDNDASDSSSSDEQDEETENIKKINNEIKMENNKEQKSEKEFMIDSKTKYNEGDISDELNENDKGKNKNNIFEKKLNLNENKLNLKEDIENNENLNEIFRKHGKSCKVMKNKYSLSQNQNETHEKIIISSILTKAGICDEQEKINQDSHLIIENLFFQNFNIYGIFDGHGDNGHLISKYISDFMISFYNNKLNYFLNENDKNNVSTEEITKIFLKNYDKIIKNGSLLLDQEINTKINYDISQSGSTSIMVFLLDDILICSNVGDSQCYLFKCSSQDLWTYESLSILHLATDENEQKRIIENGGEIHPYYEENGIFEGPDRIYAKNQIYPGLVMSRTIGDLEAKKIGVISDPDIILKKIDNNSKFLVIGSDGLWDVIKPYDIIRMARPFFNKGDIEGVSNILMKKAVNQWKKNNEERDDITIIVVFIGTPNNLINEKKNFLNKIEESEKDKEVSSKQLNEIN